MKMSLLKGTYLKYISLHELLINGYYKTRVFSLIQQHHLKQCSLQVIDCRIAGCTKQFRRNLQAVHEASCNEREINCQYCDEVIKFLKEQVI